jgi:hypothetical protein
LLAAGCATGAVHGLGTGTSLPPAAPGELVVRINHVGGLPASPLHAKHPPTRARPVLTAAPTYTLWRFHGRKWMVLARPLLPDERTCADLDR